jgi:hypothetical protein
MHGMDQALDLAPGDEVVHDTFGPGLVTAVRGTGDTAQAEVEFGEPAGRKWLLLRYAPLVVLTGGSAGLALPTYGVHRPANSRPVLTLVPDPDDQDDQDDRGLPEIAGPSVCVGESSAGAIEIRVDSPVCASASFVAAGPDAAQELARQMRQVADALDEWAALPN